MSKRRVRRSPVERLATSADVSERLYRQFAKTMIKDQLLSPSELLKRLSQGNEAPGDARHEFFVGLSNRTIDWLVGRDSFETADLDNDDLNQIVRWVREMWGAGSDEPHTQCKWHGWVAPTSIIRRCYECPCELPLSAARLLYDTGLPDVPPPPGRWRRYCSDACRQRAYRRRHRDGGEEQT